MRSEPVVFRGGPLSNFAACLIELPCPHTGRATTYPTVEHRFQAAKSQNRADHDWVLAQATPKEAKRAGRHVRLRDDWEQIKEAVMREALHAKFASAPFRTRLMSTGGQPIIEESRHDLYWGARPTTTGWEGANRLGMLLMEVRAQIGREHPAEPNQLSLGL